MARNTALGGVSGKQEGRDAEPRAAASTAGKGS